MSVHILWTEPQEEIRLNQLGERWCFGCRKRRQFEHVVTAPVEPSYYGPTHSVKCSGCGLVDGDLFPGREREWSEEDGWELGIDWPDWR